MTKSRYILIYFNYLMKFAIIEETKALRAAYAHPPSPIKNITAPCLSNDPTTGAPNSVMCSDVKNRAFFDSVHYTSTWQTKVRMPLIHWWQTISLFNQLFIIALL